MILKASQRGNGQNLAAHLMRADDNEHVQLYELRGFTSDNLGEAFKEAEAISLGTKCQQFLFSVSLNPPQGACLSEDVFAETANRIEKRLGLTDQPRAIVFHEKEGRRHAHCVWSRIDAETMTAKHLPFFKNNLMSLSRDLYLEHGWQMPRGLTAQGQKNPLNFTLMEWQQAKRIGVDPRLAKEAIQQCWARSDNAKSFGRSLEEHGMFLAKGDRRGFVVVDYHGNVQALSRALGIKTKEVAARLGDSDALADVDATKKRIAKKITPALKAHVAEAQERFAERSNKLGSYKAEMTAHHRKAREALSQKQKTDWDNETRHRAARLPRGLKGLWHRLTGRYQTVRAENERDAAVTLQRQAAERQALIEKQMKERAVLQERFKELRQRQALLLNDLRKDVGRYLRLANETRDKGHKQDLGQSLKLQR